MSLVISQCIIRDDLILKLRFQRVECFFVTLGEEETEISDFCCQGEPDSGPCVKLQAFFSLTSV